MNIQDWFPLILTGLISLQSKGLSRVFSNTTVQKHQFFSTQLSLWFSSHIHTWLLGKPQLWPYTKNLCRQSTVSAFFFFLKNNLSFIYLWLHWVFVAACGLSLAAVIRGYSLAAVCEVSTVVVSPAVGHRLVGSWASVENRFSICGARA